MPVSGGGGQSTISRAQLKQFFEAQLLNVLGDVKFLYTPSDGETTSGVEASSNGATVTHSASVVSVLSKQGSGNQINYSSRYDTVLDNAVYSFGNGSVDSAFSLIVLASIVDSAANRALITKAATNDGTGDKAEWEFIIDTADKLLFRAWSNGTATSVNRISNSAITQGAYKLFAMTYSGGSGATAMNNVKLYENAVEIASTATNDGSYAAMTNTASAVNISRDFYTLGNFYPVNSPIALTAIVGGALTAAQLYAVKKLCNGFFNLSM